MSDKASIDFQMSQLNHISDEEIQKDMEDTLQEIEEDRTILDILAKNRPGNKLEIMKKEVWTRDRKAVIKKLERIQAWRKERGDE